MQTIMDPYLHEDIKREQLLAHFGVGDEVTNEELWEMARAEQKELECELEEKMLKVATNASAQHWKGQSARLQRVR